MWIIVGEKLKWLSSGCGLKNESILTLTETKDNLSWIPDTDTNSFGDIGDIRQQRRVEE